MKRFGLYVVFLLFFSHSSAYGISGISNGYGKFVVAKTANEYAVTFVLNPANKKFENIKEVTMTDSGDDGDGNVSTVLYRNGDKEVFFRDEGDYSRYVLEYASSNVCEDWSTKIVYHEDRRAWACSKMIYFVRLYMWWQIDQGLVEAKKGEWDALEERVLENVEKLKK